MTAANRRPAMSPGRATVIGGLLIAIGSVSMALYTPAMPTLVGVFGTSMGMIKTTLTAYFAGFALAQLVCGPLSDGYGRRPISFIFLAVYVVGSLAAMVAPTAETMIAARFLQGVGAAVGVAISRAVVRDLFSGQESARVMNSIGIVLALGPAVAPTLGGLLLQFAGWHSIFVAMVMAGLAALAMVRWSMPETNANRDPALARPGQVVVNYGRLLVDRRFMVPAVTMGMAIGLFYMLGTVLPFVLIDRVGMSPTHFGFGMLAQTGSFLAGGFLVRRLLMSFGASRMILPGLIVALFGALGTVPLGHWIEPSYTTVMVPVGIYAFAAALVLPGLTTEALAPFARVAGSASALMGFIQMGSGFLGGVVATFFSDPVIAIGTIFPAMLLFGLSVYLWGRWRDRASA